MIKSVKHQLRRYLARRLRLPEIPVALDRVRALGFSPSLIFDVGAYEGEFARLCISRWRNATIACFEPQASKADELVRFAQSVAAEVRVFPVLLGQREHQRIALHQAETASSVLIEKASPQLSQSFHTMTTVDDVVRVHFGGHYPELLKLDVQGYELEVLKGATRALSRAQMILAEINLLDLYEDVPLMAEVVSWLNNHHFVAYDICGLIRRPLDGALWQIDMIFVPRDSALRADKRWGR